ncbi:unnamed protein product [Candidula unifasciata]|uniref:Leucine-rich melanocyte differentiation-associated protein n=1 Tax=Candidula unifasciata TaxID=100452 RepID=A0A8S3YIK8_9EUPU|nr:unnamed protein product [Candidula unifasciata]
MNPSHTPEQNGVYSDRPTYTFEEGQLSFLGADVEVLPEELIQNYCNVTSQLDLSFNKLRSLRGLEHFQHLRELVLDNNELNDNILFPHLKDLHTLTLNKNKLTDLHGLLEQLVEKLPSLTYLSLLGNKACPNELSALDKDDEDYLRYRHYVLYKLPGLKFLDSSPVTAAEVAEAKRVGPYTLVVRPKDEDLQLIMEDTSAEEASRDQYTPLPASVGTEIVQPQGFWTKSKSKYVGRNSEGNRFITDGVL